MISNEWIILIFVKKIFNVLNTFTDFINRYGLQGMPLTQYLQYHFPANKVIVNPCRNQNYRKYFQLRSHNARVASLKKSEWNWDVPFFDELIFSYANRRIIN